MKFAILCTLFAACITFAFAQENQEIIVMRNFHGDNCESDNENESTVSIKYVNDQCLKIAPLAWAKWACDDQLKYSLCTDENCQNCGERSIAESECVADENVHVKCDTMENISQYVDLSNVMWKITAFTSQGDQPQCEDNNKQWLLYVLKDKCHQITENMFMRPASENQNENETELHFFSDAQCNVPLEDDSTAGSDNKITLKVNECIQPSWLPEYLSLKIEKADQNM
mmetsp:Transcript_3954/g.14958  ORF Transcript_3954/g.14958 Transcript_3954/m.14958 type:complete len:228 (-) Transcript_3954:2709-3392(-)